jgi:hypothetical protein
VRSRSLRAGLIVTAITVLLGLGVAEAAVRWIQPVPVSELLPFPFHHVEIARLANRESYLRFDADLGWSQEPGAHAVDDGIVFEANEAGFRADHEYSVEPLPGVRRLEAFGDSFIHCDEVSYQDCWTSRLEGAWERSEVLNFGIPASAPDQGWCGISETAVRSSPARCWWASRWRTSTASSTGTARSTRLRAAWR